VLADPAAFIVNDLTALALPAPFVAVNVIDPELAAVGVPESTPP